MRPDLHQAVAHWQGRIENAGVSEVTHGKAVQPLERAGYSSAILFVFDSHLAGKHLSDLNTGLETRYGNARGMALNCGVKQRDGRLNPTLWAEIGRVTAPEGPRRLPRSQY